MANPPPDNAATDPASEQSKGSKDTAPGEPRKWPRPWWLIFVVLMAANYMVMRVLYPEPSSMTVSYTFFKKQVEAGNVEKVTGVGDSIHGSFKTEVTYPTQESQAPSA